MTRSARTCALAVLLIGAGLGSGEEPAPKKLQMGFEDTPTDSLPTDWKIHETAGRKKPATWRVVADAKAAAGKQILALTATENSGKTFNQCVYSAEGATWADLEISVRWRADGGGEDQGGGFVWRWQDADNYYIARANPLEGNIRVYLVEKGVRGKPCIDVKIPMEFHQWYTLRVVHVGGKLELFHEGKKLGEAEGQTALGKGRIGLWTKADAVTSFDELTVTPAMVRP